MRAFDSVPEARSRFVLGPIFVCRKYLIYNNEYDSELQFAGSRAELYISLS